MRENVKEGIDIDKAFLSYEQNKMAIAHCPEYSSDKALIVKDNEIAAFRKFIYAPDSSANLDKQQCREISIDTTNMPDNRHQGDLNWCFAFTAADLFSFHEKKKLSAYDIALQYHNNDIIRQTALEKNINDFSQVGGWPVYALIASVKGKGACLEEETNYMGEDWEKLSNFFKSLVNPEKELVSILCENKLTQVQPFVSISPDIMNILNKLSGDKKAAALLDVTCKRHLPVNNYGLYSLNTEKSDKTQIMKTLDALLRKGLPASVGYSSEVLNNGVNFVGKSATHASTIIGRKFNESTGQCEYLIRNSWGSEDVCQRTSSIRCDKGNYWIPRTALKNNIEEVMWMEIKKPKTATETQK